MLNSDILKQQLHNKAWLQYRHEELNIYTKYDVNIDNV